MFEYFASLLIVRRWLLECLAHISLTCPQIIITMVQALPHLSQLCIVGKKLGSSSCEVLPNKWVASFIPLYAVSLKIGSSSRSFWTIVITYSKTLGLLILIISVLVRFPDVMTRSWGWFHYTFKHHINKFVQLNGGYMSYVFQLNEIITTI